MRINIHLILPFGIFIILILLEKVSPLKQVRGDKKLQRKLKNLSLFPISLILLKALLPYTLVSIAKTSSGPFKQVDFLGALVLQVALYDLLIYWQHRISHSLRIFWRVHRTHHLDNEIDTTTGVRFHPFEIFLSYLYKMFFIYTLGMDPWAVLAGESVLIISSFWIHANFNLPEVLNKYLSYIIMTPQSHTIHHSVIGTEMNRNFGTFLSIWDRVFGTYTCISTQRAKSIEFGLLGKKDVEFQEILLDPFKNYK